MTPQIKQIVDYIADSFINYEQIVAESENKVLINIESKYRNTFFDKSLSHGVPSLILMYSSLYKVTKDERYLTFSNIYVEKLVDIISRDGIESPSLYAGTAGIALAIKEASISGKYYPKLLSSLNCLLKEQIKDKLVVSFSNIEKGIIEPYDYDMVNGFSGITNYLLLEQEFFSVELNQIGNYLLKYIETILNKVTNCSEDREAEFDLGIAHGITGPMLILAKLKSEKILSVEVGDILNKAINLMFLFRRDDKLWPGKIYTSNILDLDLNYLPTRMAWCYGTPGTAVALKNVYSLTMCHGLAGVTFIYDLIGKNYSSERLTRFAEELRQQIITSFSTTKVFGYTDREKFGEIEVELESIGILQGVSGIVLFLLNPYSDEELLWQRIFI
ncbi:TPA: lanthionine synthetase C family protein [Streptococcus pyogenes]